MLIQNASIVFPDRVEANLCVRIRESKVERIGNLQPEIGESLIDATACYLAPGFIELHMHVGYMGLSLDEELVQCSANLPACGTTGYLVTLISALAGDLPECFRVIRRHMKENPAGAKLLGVHLEGPYIAEEARGGFLPNQITTPEKFSIDSILDEGRDLIRTITLSPELPGILPIIAECRRRGIVVGLGHTKGGEAEYVAARQAGASHLTHCYNNRRDFPTTPKGGRGFNLDDLGVADDAVTCELICDGVHVHPVWIKTLFRTKGVERICLITDSFNAGRPMTEGDAFQTTGGQIFHVRDGVGRDAVGGLSGSVLTQDRAVRTFMKFAGADLSQAVCAASLGPARILGIEDQFGSIKAGKNADLMLLDHELRPVLTMVAGRTVHDSQSRGRIWPK
jgi:N-acetylglucosamine-6-phosphate deacetylase